MTRHTSDGVCEAVPGPRCCWSMSSHRVESCTASSEHLVSGPVCLGVLLFTQDHDMQGGAMKRKILTRHAHVAKGWCYTNTGNN